MNKEHVTDSNRRNFIKGAAVATGSKANTMFNGRLVVEASTAGEAA